MEPVDLIVTAIANEKDKYERLLLFKARNWSRQVAVPLTDSVRGRVADLKRNLASTLKAFHDATFKIASKATTAPWADIDEAVADVRSIGSEFITNLAGSEKRDELSALMNAAFPLGRNHRSEPPQILLAFDRKDVGLLGLPIELFPIMPMARSPSGISGRADLRDSLHQFPGFGAIVARRFTEESDPNPEIARCAEDRRIPVKAIRYKDFYFEKSSAVQEMSEVLWMLSREQDFLVEEWPDDTVTERAASEGIGICLYDPSVQFKDLTARREYADQIQHFSCHHERRDDGTVLLNLREPRDKSKELKVRLRWIADHLTGLNIRRPARVAHSGPLIFLNACGSGATDPTGRKSLLEYVLEETPARAIVVTETPVDYSLAAPFARLVYQGLLDDLPLGKALHEARWKLVEDDDNPFGLIYTLYGNPELRFG